jgi:hypothetical protein
MASCQKLPVPGVPVPGVLVPGVPVPGVPVPGVPAPGMPVPAVPVPGVPVPVGILSKKNQVLLKSANFLNFLFQEEDQRLDQETCSQTGKCTVQPEKCNITTFVDIFVRLIAGVME